MALDDRQKEPQGPDESSFDLTPAQHLTQLKEHGQATSSAAVNRRVERVVGYPPVSELNDLLGGTSTRCYSKAATVEDLPGNWQAAILTAEQNRPTLRLISSD